MPRPRSEAFVTEFLRDALAVEAAAAPSSSVMNCRLFIRSPRRRGRAAYPARLGRAPSRS
jgi:hypothetical protein